jgi:hypothetical protein
VVDWYYIFSILELGVYPPPKAIYNVYKIIILLVRVQSDGPGTGDFSITEEGEIFIVRGF